MIQLFDIKTRTLGFAFCQPQKSPYQNLSPKKSHYKISNPKKSSDRRFQTPKRASHIPVTYIPEYPPGTSSEEDLSATSMDPSFLADLQKNSLDHLQQQVSRCTDVAQEIDQISFKLFQTPLNLLFFMAMKAKILSAG